MITTIFGRGYLGLWTSDIGLSIKIEIKVVLEWMDLRLTAVSTVGLVSI